MDIVDRLWESDAASALTNEAAREITTLRARVAELEAYGETQRQANEFQNRHNGELIRKLVAANNALAGVLAKTFEEAAQLCANHPDAGFSSSRVRMDVGLTLADAIRTLAQQPRQETEHG